MNWLFTLIDRIMTKLYPTVLPIVTPESAPVVPATSVFPPKIELWAEAVTQGEGARPGLCNPGNLKYSSLTASWGAVKGRQASDGGWLCKFATMAQGHTALCNFLLLAAEGELIISHPRPCTLQTFTVKYAGKPPQPYIDRIARVLSVPTSVDISTFLVV